ncbi:hypothetical protein QP028_03730 [Corynebacterium suedekumii]|nr:hypothetical protein QP028_03730 [Corynebacterium suedekumii]
MTWTLALTATASGIGAAVDTPDAEPRTVGYFPDVARAVRFAADEAGSRTPDRAVMIIPAGITEYDLKWFLGELVIAGIPAQQVQVRADYEILTTATDSRVLLIDADRGILVTPPAGSLPYHRASSNSPPGAARVRPPWSSPATPPSGRSFSRTTPSSPRPSSTGPRSPCWHSSTPATCR